MTEAAVEGAVAAGTGLTAGGRRFLLQVVAVAAVAAGFVGLGRTGGPIDWSTFALLLVAAPAVQAAATQIGRNQVFHAGLAFTVAAALLLPPAGFVAVCVVQHLPDWIRQRYPWYIQTFNIANFVLSATVAWAVWTAAEELGGGADRTGSVRETAAAIAAGAAFVLVNHALLGRMLQVARGHSLRSAALFSLNGLLTDATLAAIGIGIATVLPRNPLVAALVALPLILVQRASVIPELRAQAERDPKTELLNMRGFQSAAEAEISRSARFDRPLALVVADIDNLRAINNAHGHLAGDAAVSAVADAIRFETRDFDLCARFGGDEFLILLPETTAAEAQAVLDRITARLASRPLREAADAMVEISVGISCRSAAGETLETLVRLADEAMYADKTAANR